MKTTRIFILAFGLSCLLLLLFIGLQQFSQGKCAIWIPPFMLVSSSTGDRFVTFIGILSVLFLLILYRQKNPLIRQVHSILFPLIVLLTGLFITAVHFQQWVFDLGGWCNGGEGSVRGALMQASVSFAVSMGGIIVATFYSLCGLIIIAVSQIRTK